MGPGSSPRMTPGSTKSRPNHSSTLVARYVVKTIAAVFYRPELEFYERMYHAAAAIKGFPDWETDRLSVTLRNTKKRCSFAIGHSRIVYDQDRFDEDLEVEQLEDSLPTLLSSLRVEEVLRVEYRRWYLYPVKLPFAELADLCALKLLSPDRTLATALPGRPNDLLYRVSFLDGKANGVLNLAPVWKDQVPKVIPFNQANHLPPKSAAADYIHVLQSFPDAAVTMDFDYSMEKPTRFIEPTSPLLYLEEVKQVDILPFFANARAAMDKSFSSVVNYLFDMEKK